jgi:hypothetical protein
VLDIFEHIGEQAATQVRAAIYLFHFTTSLSGGVGGVDGRQSRGAAGGGGGGAGAGVEARVLQPLQQNLRVQREVILPQSLQARHRLQLQRLWQAVRHQG